MKNILLKHFDKYGTNNHIASTGYVQYLQVCQEIDCALTEARILEEVYDCNLFHMDDFFLRPEQRTPERFAEPGGNVDYERFKTEI